MSESRSARPGQAAHFTDSERLCSVSLLSPDRTDVSCDTVRRLQKALCCNANVLIVGDVAGGRRLFQAYYPRRQFRVLPAERLNREGAEALLPDRGGDLSVIFLDRVDSLHRWVQHALLDVLEDVRSLPNAHWPVGRLISAAQRDLAQMAEEGIFSKPLFLRLSALTIYIPPWWKESPIPRAGENDSVSLFRGVGPNREG